MIDLQAITKFDGVPRHELEARLREASKELEQLRSAASAQDAFCARLREALGPFSGGSTMDEDVRQLVREYTEMFDNLTATQARCTSLLDEARANARIAKAPSGELHALSHLSHERRRQDAKWGPLESREHVPFRTGGADDQLALEIVRRDVEEHQRQTGQATCCWRHVLLEEALEVLAEGRTKHLRAELVQLGAVCVEMIEMIDWREPCLPTSPPGKEAVEGITLPGWHCSCGAFNGSAMGLLTMCRACGGPYPVAAEGAST